MNQQLHTEITGKAQAKFHHFIGKFNDGFTVPEYKAIRDISYGILASGSTIVYQSARELKEKTRPKKTAERFYRNLKRPDFDARIRERLMELQCRKFHRDTLIIVDDSDIVKRYATKMAGIKPVRDGSSGETAPGYDLVNFVACQPNGGNCELLPLSSDLVSRGIEPDSLRNLHFDRINDITVHSGNRGIFVFDRGFDSRRVIDELVKNDNAFIIRSMEQRHFDVNGTLKSIREIRRETPLPYRVEGAKPGSWFECGIQPVRIRLSDHPGKSAPMAELYLVLARHRNHRNNRNGWFSFLCRFPNQHPSLEDVVHKTLSSYRLRWKIEETHRHVKQDFGWEMMQLMSYTGLKNLNVLLWLALAFLYSLKKDIIKFAASFPRIIEPEKGLRFFCESFVYYRLAHATKELFRGWMRYDTGPYRGRYHDLLQLRVTFP